MSNLKKPNINKRLLASSNASIAVFSIMTVFSLILSPVFTDSIFADDDVDELDIDVDEVIGDNGENVIVGNGFIQGTDDDDMIFAGDGDNIIRGKDGNDEIVASLGNDYVRGDDDNDQIMGGYGADMLYGSDDDDYLVGGDGDDLLYGEDGNDVLNGGYGDDQLAGGKDADIFTCGDGYDEVKDYSISDGDQIGADCEIGTVPDEDDFFR